MAKNVGREFATMDEEERRRFAMEPEGTDTVSELDFEDPRREPAGEVRGEDPAIAVEEVVEEPGPEAA